MCDAYLGKNKEISKQLKEQKYPNKKASENLVKKKTINICEY